MDNQRLRELYFEWLYKLACGRQRRSYKKLCRTLDGIEFTYSIPMDANRWEDGVDLRYRFGYENDISNPVIASVLDCRPCSMLEMMVALAFRCQEHICDCDLFIDMLRNMELVYSDDSHFDERLVIENTRRVLNRAYERNGRGGLFTIRSRKEDIRTVDIWYQAMWYLTEREELR